MPDLILRDIEPALLDRVRRLADTQACSLEAALLAVLERGLACSSDFDSGLDDSDARVLREAIAALENVPSDPGFALIGRAVPASPAVPGAPDQTVAPALMLPR
jgi:hypothetical protein